MIGDNNNNGFIVGPTSGTNYMVSGSQKNYAIFFKNLGTHVNTFENLAIKVQERAADLHGISQTLRGRLNLFLSFIAAKIWYVAKVCIIPNSYIKQFTLTMFSFIWGGGGTSGTFERIKRDTLYLSKEKGGLEVPDLGLRIKAFTVKHLAEFYNKRVLSWGIWRIISQN